MSWLWFTMVWALTGWYWFTSFGASLHFIEGLSSYCQSSPSAYIYIVPECTYIQVDPICDFHNIFSWREYEPMFYVLYVVLLTIASSICLQPGNDSEGFLADHRRDMDMSWKHLQQRLVNRMRSENHPLLPYIDSQSSEFFSLVNSSTNDEEMMERQYKRKPRVRFYRDDGQGHQWDLYRNAQGIGKTLSNLLQLDGAKDK